MKLGLVLNVVDAADFVSSFQAFVVCKVPAHLALVPKTTEKRPIRASLAVNSPKMFHGLKAYQIITTEAGFRFTFRSPPS